MSEPPIDRLQLEPRELFPWSPDYDSSPLPKKGRGLRKQQEEAAKVKPKPAPKPTRRHQFLRCKFFKLQSTEDAGGVSVSGEENSSDDAHLPDLSCVSQGINHPDAERHVYLQAVLPPPMHEQRFDGRMSLAGSFF